MEKGFTLKLFLIVFGLIVLMASIAFFVQRNDEDHLVEKVDDLDIEKEREEVYNEAEEEIIQDNDEEDEMQEEEIDDYEESNDNAEQVIETEEIDCGEANNLVMDAKRNLASLLEVNTNEIKIISCEKNVFSDYTLGTSGPGEVYPQQETEGYIIILQFNDQEYRYHGNENTLIFID